jgi:hypothetical protein
MITQERLKELVHYNPITGIFTRKICKPRSSVPAGNSTGSLAKGYILLKLDGKSYRAHRLAWLYMTGEYPQLSIDHIDGATSNNKWDNLRLATNSQNQCNKGLTISNTSGIKGLSKRDTRYWRAIVMTDRKAIERSFPQTEEGKQAAISWLKSAREIQHKEFAFGG